MNSIYPFGKAPLVILILAILSGAFLLVLDIKHGKEPVPDLVLATQARNHKPAYDKAIAEFEAMKAKEGKNVKIKLQLVQKEALQSRLQSALQTGSPAPDLVELLEGTIGFFTRGPIENVGFVDLTDRLKEEGLYDKFVESRYGLWSSRGHIFGLPHDVHPVGLCYRRSVIEKLGIDVTKLKTWDDFVKMGEKVSKVKGSDGNRLHFPLEMQTSNTVALGILAFQRGTGYFDKMGNVTIDSKEWLETVIWFVHQVSEKNPNRVGYDPGEGQNLYAALQDGLVLFFFTPDWRTASFQQDIPQLKGDLGLIPLPAWEPGGCRTSTWGGTGLAITKQSKNQELAWEFAKFLYCKKEDLAARFSDTNLLPPFKDAWTLPEFKQKSEFYGGQSIGEFFIDIADETPANNASPYTKLATDRTLDAVQTALHFYDENYGKMPTEQLEAELRTLTEKLLKEKADYVRAAIKRNVFLSADAEAAAASVPEQKGDDAK